MISARLLFVLGLCAIAVLFLPFFVLGEADAMATCQLHHSFGTCHDALN